MPPDPIVIAGYARTAIGTFRGVFDNLPAPELGAAAIRRKTRRQLMRGRETLAVLLHLHGADQFRARSPIT